jgi:hypothetical protein
VLMQKGHYHLSHTLSLFLVVCFSDKVSHFGLTDLGPILLPLIPEYLRLQEWASTLGYCDLCFFIALSTYRKVVDLFGYCLVSNSSLVYKPNFSRFSVSSSLICPRE